MLLPASTSPASASDALPFVPAGQDTTAGESIPFIARFLPSATDLAFVMPLVFLFAKLDGARTLLGDGDTGWHVRAGEWILANHKVPAQDIFSFSRPDGQWFAWEWLWDVLFAMLHQRWGMAAVVLASTAVICLTGAFLFRLVRRKCGNGLVAVAVTLLATGGCAIHWLARPHLFTLLFVTITLHITERAREGRTRLLAWLVPMVLLWTNLHGGFFFVFLILACYIGSDLLNAVIERNPGRRREFLLSVKPWAAVFAGCFAVTFLNPYGWQLHKHVIEYIADPYAMQHITEFQSMNFHAPVTVYFEPLMVLSIVVALWDARHRRFADVFLSMGWLHLALIAQRNIPIFCIAAAPIVARGLVTMIRASAAPGLEISLAPWLAGLARRFQTFAASVEVNDRIPRVHLVSAVPLMFVGALLLATPPSPGVLSNKFISTYDPAVYPEKALSQVRGADTGNIFTHDEWGDYLIYHLYPSKKVFVDGRSDFYGTKFCERYLDLVNVQPGWKKTLEDYSIDTIVIGPKFALAQTLKVSPDWRLVSDDTVALVFRRRSGTPVSLVSSRERKDRDRAITKPITRDPAITQPTT